MRGEASVVVPVLNQHHDWLSQCIRSALDQTVPTDTIVVVSPRTRKAIRRFLHRMVRHHDRLRVLMEEGHGFAAALNTGIRAARAPRVGFLLSDDWLDPDAIDKCLPVQADIVSTGLTVYAADGKGVLTHLNRSRSLVTFHSLPTLERKAGYLTHFLFFRREVLLAVGGVDEAVGSTGPDDFDLIWTLLERGASVGVTDRPLYNYRDHSGERLTLRPREAQIGDLGKILDKHGVTGEERQAIIDWHALSYGHPVHVTWERRRGMVPPGFPAPGAGLR